MLSEALKGSGSDEELYSSEIKPICLGATVAVLLSLWNTMVINQGNF
jgi:hypothetical protein